MLIKLPISHLNTILPASVYLLHVQTIGEGRTKQLQQALHTLQTRLKLISHLTANTRLLHYKDFSVNCAQRNNLCPFWESYERNKNALENAECFNLRQVVLNTVGNGHYKVKNLYIPLMQMLSRVTDQILHSLWQWVFLIEDTCKKNNAYNVFVLMAWILCWKSFLTVFKGAWNCFFFPRFSSKHLRYKYLTNNT